jgi:hypothetical protein
LGKAISGADEKGGKGKPDRLYRRDHYIDYYIDYIDYII